MENITNRIIDIHNHSLFGVDDGARDITESIEGIKYLINLGIKDIVLTSHYINETKYQANVLRRKSILQELKEATKDLDINLYIGNEVFASEKVIELLNSGEITTLNGSRYLLIEFPLDQNLKHIEEIVCDLNEVGIVPIIAHPERYRYFKENYNKLEDLLEYDCLLQCNIESIVGKYGRHAKKLITRLLKEHKVSFLATDFHHISHAYLLEKGLKKLRKKIKSLELNLMLYENPKKVLENEKI